VLSTFPIVRNEGAISALLDQAGGCQAGDPSRHPRQLLAQFGGNVGRRRQLALVLGGDAEHGDPCPEHLIRELDDLGVVDQLAVHSEPLAHQIIPRALRYVSRIASWAARSSAGILRIAITLRSALTS